VTDAAAAADDGGGGGDGDGVDGMRHGADDGREVARCSLASRDYNRPNTLVSSRDVSYSLRL